MTGRAELLLDFGGVPVREHAVGGDAAVALGEVRALARRLARARDARLRVDDDVAGEQARARPAARARAAPPSDSSRGTRPAARRAARRGDARSGRRPIEDGIGRACADTTARGVGVIARRNAPDRSNTRTPRASKPGASSAAASSGSARNTTSTSRRPSGLDVERRDRRRPTACASAGQRPRRARGARGHGTRKLRHAGWRASRRTSSCPA